MTISAPKGPRFQAWAAAFVFSCVSLASHDSRLVGTKSASDKWILSMLSISLILSFFGIIGYSAMNEKFIGQKPEGGLCTVLLAIWCAGLPGIMDPGNGYAVTGALGSPVVVNSNLYFFSWITFMCVLYIYGHWMQEITGRDVAAEVTPKYAKWGGLFATSIVVLAASAKIHINQKCTKYGDSSFCQRTSYSVSVGVLGILFSMAAIFLMKTNKLVITMEAGLAVVMFVFYTFGVSFVTFGSGPATSIGNLYFAMWIGFAITVFLASQCVREVMASRDNGSENTTDNEKASTPPEVEQPIEATDENA